MKKEETKQDNPVFTKEQLLVSRRYEHQRDVLAVILRDGQNYSYYDVDSRIEKFMKGKVK